MKFYCSATKSISENWQERIMDEFLLPIEIDKWTVLSDMEKIYLKAFNKLMSDISYGVDVIQIKFDMSNWNVIFRFTAEWLDETKILEKFDKVVME